MAKGFMRSGKSDKHGHSFVNGMPVHVKTPEGTTCKKCGKAYSMSKAQNNTQGWWRK